MLVPITRADGPRDIGVPDTVTAGASGVKVAPAIPTALCLIVKTCPAILIVVGAGLDGSQREMSWWSLQLEEEMGHTILEYRKCESAELLESAWSRRWRFHEKVFGRLGRLLLLADPL